MERTIQSVIKQTYPHIEYLIIDGGSKDGTWKIVEQYQQHIYYSVSEPDKGIYDAMNKGLQQAKGEYVWFMNAGDELYDEHTLATIAAQKAENADVFYGDALFVSQEGKALGLRSQVTPHRLPNSLTWHDMGLGMVVCHQSFVVKKAIAPPYDEVAHPYSADVDWEIKCLKQARKVVKIDGPISRYLTGGFSRRNLQKSLTDRFDVLKNHFGFWGAIKNHGLIALRGLIFMVKKKGKYW